MTGKLKLALIAAIAAVSFASPALAQTTTTQNGLGNTHQERSLGSGQRYNYIPSQDLPPNYCDGAAGCSPGGGGDY
jgi:hypothetical protein